MLDSLIAFLWNADKYLRGFIDKHPPSGNNRYRKGCR